MTKIETAFTADIDMTPQFAAKLSEAAMQYDAGISLICKDKQLTLDSLICILSLDLYKNVPVTVVADGKDEEAAAKAIAAILEGH
ncbi:MAG: HPr family phosphocarrier protein [Clostridia bacterium]|nr:HPr family phosphocarrier protein [Clostridia bacterium]